MKAWDCLREWGALPEVVGELDGREQRGKIRMTMIA